MDVYIEILNGKTITLNNIDSNINIKTIKEKIQEKDTLTSVDRQRLFFNEKLLEDEFTLNDYNIKNDDTIIMILKVKLLNKCIEHIATYLKTHNCKDIINKFEIGNFTDDDIKESCKLHPIFSNGKTFNKDMLNEKFQYEFEEDEIKDIIGEDYHIQEITVKEINNN